MSFREVCRGTRDALVRDDARPSVQSSVHAFASPVEPLIDALTLCVETSIHAFALAFDPVGPALALALDAICAKLMAVGPSSIRSMVSAILDAIRLVLESVLDAIPPSIESIFDPVAAAIEPLLDPVPLLVETLRSGRTVLGRCDRGDCDRESESTDGEKRKTRRIVHAIS